MILYKKIGRRYVPVQEYVDMTGWSEGDYLVQVRPGVKSAQRLRLNPDYPAALAALREAEEAMIAAVQTASEAEPDRKLNPKQQEARDAFVAACQGMTFTRRSAVNIVRAGMKVLEGKVK